MNYIKHLTGFFDRVAKDKQLNPTHISLYIALFQFWNCNRFKNPISISRDEIMRISKISSKATYHKCLKALHAQGYIRYEPSYNPFKGSHVYLFNFSDDLKPLPKNTGSNFKSVDDQVVNKLDTGIETSLEQPTEQVVVPYTNNTNNTNSRNDVNSLNSDAQAQKNEEENLNFKNEKIGKEEKGSAEKEEKKEMPDQVVPDKNQISSPAFADYNAEHTNDSRQKKLREKKKDAPPDIQMVKAYFLDKSFPITEAEKFFNYFSSIGWLVGGKIPMVDWKAAADNWMLNAPKFNTNERTDTRKQFDTSADKDYSEPL